MLKNLFAETFKFVALMLVVSMSLAGCINKNDIEGQPSLTYAYPKLTVNPKTLYMNPLTEDRVYGIGGTGKYTFSLGSGSTLGTIDPITGIFEAGPTSGQATVIITDSKGVVASGNIIILDPLKISPVNGFVTVNAQIQITATGGLAPYTFSINNTLGTIDPKTGILSAGPTLGQSVLTVMDAKGNKSSTTIQFAKPLELLPKVGAFPTDRPLKLSRIGGQGQLTYTFVKGEGLVDVDPVNNILTPNPTSTGTVQLNVTDELGYSTSVELSFFKIRHASIGRRHGCGVDTNGVLYCWGANDQGQIGDTVYGPNVGDDPLEMGDALLAVNNFSNIYDIAATGHTTCILYSPGGPGTNKALRCWGAKSTKYRSDIYSPKNDIGTWAEQNLAEGASAYSNLFLHDGEYDFIKHLPGGPTASVNYPWARNSALGDTVANALGFGQDYMFGVPSKAPYLNSLMVRPGGGYRRGDIASGFAASSAVLWHVYDPSSNIGSFNHGAIGDGFHDGGNTGASRQFTNFSNGNADDISLGKIHSTHMQATKISGANFLCTVVKIYGALSSSPLSWNPALNYNAAYNGSSRIICGGNADVTGSNYGDCYYSANTALTYNGCTKASDNKVTGGTRVENSISFSGGQTWTGFYNLQDSPQTPIDGLNGYFTTFTGKHSQFANIFAERNGMLGEKNALDVVITGTSGGSKVTRTVCGLFDDTTLSGKNIIQCWGSNNMGTLGIGLNDQLLSVTKSPVTTSSPPYKFYAQPYGSITTSGVIDSLVQLPSNRNPVALYTDGDGTICAQTYTTAEPGYRLYCWGQASYGQMGDGFYDPNGATYKTSPIEVTAMVAAQSGGYILSTIKAHSSAFCALFTHATAPNKLMCWGSNVFGRLGQEKNEVEFPVGSPMMVNLGTGFSVKAFSIGTSHGCAVSTTDAVKCWGSRAFGQLGAYRAAIQGDEPQEVANGLNKVVLEDDIVVKEVYSGLYHNCMILDGTKDGQVACFGANGNKQLGLGALLKNVGDIHEQKIGATLTLDSGTLADSKIKKMTGRLSTFALADDGKLYSWGANVGSYATRSVAGCASRDLSWANLLGRGSTASDIGTPGIIPISTRIPGRKVVDVSAGMAHACVALSNGEVHCWGTNSCRKALGRHNDTGILASNVAVGSSDAAENATRVNLGTFKAVGVASGVAHTCALSDTGAVKCWGANDRGQLGINVSNTRPNPVPKDDTANEMGDNLLPVNLGYDTDGLPRKITQIVAGDYHTCGLTALGNVVCWGDNIHGQLGIGTMNSVGIADGQMGLNLPATSLPTGATAYKLTAGGNSTCAVMNSNNIYCWGENTVAQLGIGSRKPQGNTLFSIGNGLSQVLFPQ